MWGEGKPMKRKDRIGVKWMREKRGKDAVGRGGVGFDRIEWD